MPAIWHWISERSIGKAFAVLVLLLGLAASVLVWRAETQRAHEELTARTLEQVNAMAARLRQRLVAYEVMLRAGVSLFAVTATPTRAQWTSFVEAFEIESRYPEVLGVAFAPRLRPQDIAPLEHRVQAEGFDQFRVWPTGPRVEASTILYMEPMNAANARSLGFDMLTESDRRAAMHASRDSGRAALTSALTLLQDAGGQRKVGVLMYLPVYVNGGRAPGDTVDARRAAHIGWIYAPFRPAALVDSLGRGTRPSVLVRLRDSGAEGALLYRDAGLPDGVLPSNDAVHVTIEVADRAWTLEGVPASGSTAAASSTRAPWKSMFGGVLLSLLLFGVLWSMATTRDRAHRLAHAMTVALRRANAELDSRVRQRTEDLSASNEQLRAEMGERQRIEAERTAALERERERTAQLRALADAGLGVAELGDDQARLEYLADRACRIVECRHSFLVRRDASGERAAAVSSAEPMSFEKRRALLDACARWPLRERIEVVHARDNPEIAKEAWPSGCSQAMIVPIRVASRAPVATLYLLHGDERQFRLEDEVMIHQLVLLVTAAMATAEAVDSERRARVEAESANRSKDEFLAIVSHELRTPLHAILGWLQVLERKPASAEHLQRAIEVIRRNAEAQSTLIDDLLDLARIEQGKLALEMSRVRFEAMVREIAESQRQTATANGLSIDVRIEARGDVHGDPVRLQQAVSNLVVNAVKFSSPGGHVGLRLYRDEGSLVLDVEDDGEGIDPQLLPKLFERFRQADASSRRRQGGLGLGLALVKHIIEAHGGTVCAASAGKGRGAVFSIRLPILESVEDVAEALQPLPGVRGPVPRESVLVIDDNVDARDAISNWLHEESFDVVARDSVKEAIAWLESRAAQDWPGVVLCDIEMPENDGYDFLEALRGLEARLGRQVATPVVALTAYAAGDDRARALDFGFVAHLAKPFSPEHLERVLLRVLRVWREEVEQAGEAESAGAGTSASADVRTPGAQTEAPRGEAAATAAAHDGTPPGQTPTAERRYRS